ncbi:MAG TPA: hypothetical protein VIW73_03850 [Candidatus Cybelea sp.]
MLEEVVRDLPGFLTAGQRAQAKAIADRDELEGWLGHFQEWSARANTLAMVIDDLWFDAPVSLRKHTMVMLSDLMAGGVTGMKAILRLSPQERGTLPTILTNVTAYMDSVTDLTQKVHRLADDENLRLAAFQGSTELRRQTDKDYEQGKREAAAGKVTHFTPDEFRKRFA